MDNENFVHLRLHTEFSITDSVVKIEDICRVVSKDRMPALAITDNSNIFGAIKFYKIARHYGIKPIIGCDVILANEKSNISGRIIFLVQNDVGYLNLSKLLSKGVKENFDGGVPMISKSWLCKNNTDGLIVLSGGLQGEVFKTLRQGQVKQTESILNFWKSLMGDRFYVEINRIGDNISDRIMKKLIFLSKKIKIAIVACHPIQFVKPEDFNAHEAKVCISDGLLISDSRRNKEYSNEQYFYDKSKIFKIFSDIPEALANTVEIAKRCNFNFKLGNVQLPNFPTPKGITIDDFLKKNAIEGLSTKLSSYKNKDKKLYFERLNYELKVIVSMGYSGYFLIVSDFINWAKNNFIPVGPGRGSGAGSLVAYSLGITTLDPLEYNLLFERFLNPERVSLPDFDIDFCQNKRDKVIDYVKSKYGDSSVSQIATFGTMAAKAVVRDVGRVLDWSYTRADELAKLIPTKLDINLKLAREMEPKLIEYEKSDIETKELLSLADQLEGLIRNVGMHAGGVLIAPKEITNFCPIYKTTTSESLISQFDKDDVESIGLIKFDFLGLTTLTIIDMTINFIKLIEPKNNIKIDEISLDDSKTYNLFSKANTVAIFQFESHGMKDLLLRAKPNKITEIMALVSLYRPGPMELIPDYISRKNGEPYVLPDEKLRYILEETFGIMIYQEQVMQIAQTIGGYSLGSADILRKAMGKKKPEEMSKQRNIFVSGAKQNGLTEKKATELFEKMEKFAGYGFNKSHAAVYALIAYQTAYLKTHHKAAFMAANLSLVMDDTDKIKLLIDDLKLNNINLIFPDINKSQFNFEPKNKENISFGLGAIKGVGEAAVKSIIMLRNQNPFKSLLDFCERVDKRIVNRGCIESLICAGAFDSLNKNRAALFSIIGKAIDAAEQMNKYKNQQNLFSKNEEIEIDLKLIGLKNWNLERFLFYEKKALGFYLSSHLFSVYKDKIKIFVKKKIKDLSINSKVLFAGIITAIKRINTKRGFFYSLTIEDDLNKTEIVVFKEQYIKYHEIIKMDKLLIFDVSCNMDKFRNKKRITINNLYDYDNARNKFAKRFRINIDEKIDISLLKQSLYPFKNGSVPVHLKLKRSSLETELILGNQWKVKICTELEKMLSDLLGSENIIIDY